jgi:hypothetical protein
VPAAAGFFSKDEILARFWRAATRRLRSVLITRASPRSTSAARSSSRWGRPRRRRTAHESSAAMTGPMVRSPCVPWRGAPRAVRAAVCWRRSRNPGDGARAALVASGDPRRADRPRPRVDAGTRRSFDPGRVRAAAGPLVTLLERRYFLDDLFVFAYRRVYLGVSPPSAGSTATSRRCCQRARVGDVAGCGAVSARSRAVARRTRCTRSSSA